MSAAPRAADDPRPLTPMPTSAIRIAAASLAPSPTIAVTRPQRCSARHDLHLLLRADAGEDLNVGDDFGAGVLVEAGEFGAGDHARIDRQAQLTGDRPRGDGVVAGDQHHVAVGVHQRFDQRARRCPCGVRQTDVAQQLEVLRGGVDGVGVGVLVIGRSRWSQRTPRHRQHPQALLGKAVYQRVGVRKVGFRIGEPAARQDHLGSALEHQDRRVRSLRCRCRSRRRSRGWTRTVPPRAPSTPNRLGREANSRRSGSPRRWRARGPGPSWGCVDARAAARSTAADRGSVSVRERLVADGRRPARRTRRAAGSR